MIYLYFPPWSRMALGSISMLLLSLALKSPLSSRLHSLYYLLFNAYQIFQTKKTNTELGFHPLWSIPQVFSISGGGISIFLVWGPRSQTFLSFPPTHPVSISEAWQLSESISPGPDSSHHSLLCCPSPSHQHAMPSSSKSLLGSLSASTFALFQSIPHGGQREPSKTDQFKSLCWFSPSVASTALRVESSFPWAPAHAPNLVSHAFPPQQPSRCSLSVALFLSQDLCSSCSRGVKPSGLLLPHSFLSFRHQLQWHMLLRSLPWPAHLTLLSR